MIRTADAATVPGLPESTLRPDDLVALPGYGPPAPWTCRARAVIWLQRGHTPSYAWLARPLPIAAVAFVEYLETPVGPYREVLAAGALLAGAMPIGQVPFIAVDSLPSVRGGRVNWALPKTMATFDGDVATGDVSAQGPDWSIALQAGRSGPSLPLRLRFTCAGPLGRYRTTLRANGRPVLVRTRAEGATLKGWLGAGRHLGLLVEGDLVIDAPEPG